jgi:hypothetical protein
MKQSLIRFHEVLHTIFSQSISHPHKKKEGEDRAFHHHLHNVAHVTTVWSLAVLFGLHAFFGTHSLIETYASVGASISVVANDPIEAELMSLMDTSRDKVNALLNRQGIATAPILTNATSSGTRNPTAINTGVSTGAISTNAVSTPIPNTPPINTGTINSVTSSAVNPILNPVRQESPSNLNNTSQNILSASPSPQNTPSSQIVRRNEFLTYALTLAEKRIITPQSQESQYRTEDKITR